MNYGKIIDGKEIAYNLLQDLKKSVLALPQNIKPKFSTILVGNNPASVLYIERKVKKAKELGIDSQKHALKETISQEELLKLIEKLNNDPTIHGILLQLPLPSHINKEVVLNAISPQKDIDGLNYINRAFMSLQDLTHFKPCTPMGCLYLIKSVCQNIEGNRCVVVGRSNLVGLPMFNLLNDANATVTLCHSKTKDLPKITKEADILVVAVGKPKLITANFIKKGAIVIDVGTSFVEKNGKNFISGDVDFLACQNIAAFITKVPGGVGPMTIASLMANIYKAIVLQNNLNLDNLLDTKLQ